MDDDAFGYATAALIMDGLQQMNSGKFETSTRTASVASLELGRKHMTRLIPLILCIAFVGCSKPSQITEQGITVAATPQAETK